MRLFRRHNSKLKIEGNRKQIYGLAARLAETDWCWAYGWKKADYKCGEALGCKTGFGCYDCLVKNAKVKIL